MTLNQYNGILQKDDLKSLFERGDNMTDTIKLKELISQKGLKMKFIAESLGLSAYGFQLKVENKQEFKTGEVAALCEILDVRSLREKEAIFFARIDDLKSTKKE